MEPAETDFLYCSIWGSHLRSRCFFPLNRINRQTLTQQAPLPTKNASNSRRFQTPRRRRCGLNATSQPRSQPSGAGSRHNSPRPISVVLAAVEIIIYDAVGLGPAENQHTRAGLSKSSSFPEARTQDMLNILKDERRRNGPISSNPYRTGHIFPPAALHSLDGAPLLPHANAPCWTKKYVSAGAAR